MLGFKSFMVENSRQTYERIAAAINALVKSKNYQIASTAPLGKPGKNIKSMREFRLQLVDKKNDTSDEVIDFLKNELKKSETISDLKFNSISPNSSKFPSFTFSVDGVEVDLVIARGANRGENFELQTVKNLGDYFNTRSDKEFAKLIDLMSAENKEFADAEIVKVKQRTGSTKKEGVPIEKLGAIIGDIVLTDSTGREWFISLKDVNGNTFSSYSGAATIFDSKGTLNPTSPGAEFLKAFGVDLNKVQAGFDERAGRDIPRPKYPVTPSNQAELKKIFERAWGMNYFYVRKMRSGWKVFWLDREKLNKLAGRVTVTGISYPDKKSKQITILAEAGPQKYKIEIRNSKAGEYPNDIKFKVIP